MLEELRILSCYSYGKPKLRDFSMVICLRDTKIIPIPDPLWLAAPSTYNSHNGGWDIETSETSMSDVLPSRTHPFPLFG